MLGAGGEEMVGPLRREELQDRYRYLYHEYGFFALRKLTFGQEYIAQIKLEIDSAQERQSVKFRPDAKYFLLVNIDQMLVRSHFLDHSGSGATRLVDGVSNEQVFWSIKSTVELVVGEVGRWDRASDREGISAHAIMKAVDRSWQKLSDLWAWG
jgi:hypothetical protein